MAERKNNLIKEQRKRFWEIDFLRGLCVLLMVFDHLMFAFYGFLPFINEMFGINLWINISRFAGRYWYNYYRTFFRYIVISFFMLLCGISCTLTKSNLKRGLKALGVALGMTAITLLGSRLLEFDITIWFGVIHMLAFSMLIYWVLSLPHKYFKKEILKYIPFFVGLTVLIIFFSVPLAHFEIMETFYGKHIELVSDVTVKFEQGREPLTYLLSFQDFLPFLLEVRGYPFVSSDYFPILPYALLVLIGSGIGHIIYNTRAKNYLSSLDGKWNKPICKIGQRAFIIYLLHQLVIVGILFISCFIYSKIK